MNNQMEGRSSKHLVASKTPRKVRSTTSVNRRCLSKKIMKKQLKRSSKTNKISALYEYEMKSCVTWEFVDEFCDSSNWHESLKSEDSEKQRIKLEPQMTKTEPVDETPVNEPSMEITSTGDDQQNKSAGMVEVDPVESVFNDTVMFHLTAPVHKLFFNVQNDVSVNLSASAADISAAPPNDICSEETFDKTSKKSRYPRYPTSLKRTSINDEIIGQPVPDNNTDIEAMEANIEVLNRVPEMFEHKELLNAGANDNTDGVKTLCNQKQHTKIPVQATDPKCSNQTKKKQFKCTDCQKEFTYNSTLTTHQRIHSGEKPFKCTVCPQMFSRKSTLTRHHRVHSGEKPFKCTECPQMFSHKIHLTEHHRIHSGEKPFKCTVCLQVFSLKSTLKTHQRIHSGEKPFKCTVCPQVFSQKANLRTHQRIHTGEKPFKCTHCPKEFSDQSSFKRHLRVLSGEKPFKCNECPHMFSYKIRLTEHQRIHSGEKPFKCTVCPQMFSLKRNLTTHQRIHSVNTQAEHAV